MSVYGAMVIPFIAAAVSLIFFHHRTKWWEISIPFLVSLILIGGGKTLGEYSATKDTEFRGGWVTEARYYEDWDQYIQKTCSTQSCSGSGKTRSCTTSYYDCSYVQYHPERWTVSDSNGTGHSVTKPAYDWHVKRFGVQPEFVDMRRSYHTNDGDMYGVVWQGSDATLSPLVTEHSYENRVQAARSVFHYHEFTDEEIVARGLFSYPEEVPLFTFPSVLGDCGPETEGANAQLQFHNAKLGRDKQLRMWLICTDSGDVNFGQDQEALWVGGNKNEVVLVKGDGWAHVFSWTDNKVPLIETRDFVVAQGNFDPVASVNFMAATMAEKFERKHFEDFSYLRVETPFWMVLTTYIVTLLVNIGLLYFIIHNEFHDDSGRR